MSETLVVDGIVYWTMGDAAFVENLDGTSFGVGAGYYGGPNAYHVEFPWLPSPNMGSRK